MAVTSFGGIVKHGELAGLGNDEHPQYGMWSQGLLAERPPAGRAGRTYYATDESTSYYDLGTSWVAAITLPPMNYVGLTGDEAVAGDKTFSGSTLFSGPVKITGAGPVGSTYSGTNLLLESIHPTLELHDTDNAGAGKRWWLHNNSGNFYLLQDRDGTGMWESPHPLYFDSAGTANFGISVNAPQLYAHNNSGNSVMRRDTADTTWHSGAPLMIENATSGARIAFHQPGKVASSIGQVLNSESFRTYSNAGNEYRDWYAAKHFSNDKLMAGWDLLENRYLSATTAGGLTFTLPPGYSQVRLVSPWVRHVNTTSNAHIYFQLNNDTAANYAGNMQYHTTAGWTGSTFNAQAQGWAAAHYFYGNSYGGASLEMDIRTGGARGFIRCNHWNAFGNSNSNTPGYGSETMTGWHNGAGDVTTIFLFNSGNFSWEAGSRFLVYGMRQV